MTRQSIVAASFWLLAAAFVPAAARAQDTLTNARELYASAEYERALATLNRIRATGVASADVPTVEQYRALCLLALGRSTEAEDAIAAVVSAAPSYTPAGSEVSPRVRTAFSEVRKRILPNIIQQKYNEAKAAYDRKAYQVASDGFAQVLKTLGDPDVAPLATQPPLADLRTLTQGFLDLSETALAAAAAPAASTAPEPAPTAATAAAATRIFTVTDANIVPPTIIRQGLPPFPRKPLTTIQGVVEVVIDEKGEVEAATIRNSMDPKYDTMALAASRNWRYQPATREGVPVRFRKLVQVRIQP
jgi:TonB family protein